MFYIHNLSSHTVYQQLPWEKLQKPIPEEAMAGKKEFKAWSTAPTTEHMFFSLVEGESSGLRVDAKDNVAYKIHGVVADYDSAVNTETLAFALKTAPTEFPPNYMSRTFSGNARAVWVFEAPVLVASHAVAVAFQKEVIKQLKLEQFLAGLDKPAFCRPHQYYEQGTDWQHTSDKKIGSNFIWKWMSDGCRKVSFLGGEAKIPLDVVREQIEREFPAKWKGDFSLGVRSRRFWDDQADNETAAILRDGGFQCFTGPDTFVSWGQLLGEAFVKRYDADRLGKVLQRIYYDDTTAKYWFQDAGDKWVSGATTDVTRLLKVDFGLEPRPPKGGTYSEVDKALVEVQKLRRVAAAMPFLYHKPGLLTLNKRDFLNTSWATCRTPASKTGAWGDDFPWIARYLTELFHTEKQLFTFLGWWKRAYEGGLTMKPEPGHAMFFVGPQACGKTLLNHRIVGESLGGAMDARPFLVDANQFSGSNLEYPVMALDDSSAASDAKAHQKYSAALKALVANEQHVYNQKFKAAGQVTWLGRIMVSLNDDPTSLQMIPDLETTLLDKVMIFKVHPPKTYSFPEKYDLEATVDQELPFILRWLLDWTIPAELMDSEHRRFGIIPIHDKGIHLEAQESGQSSAFLGVLWLFLNEYQTVNPGATHWSGGVASLVTDMQNCERVAAVAREFRSQQVAGILSGLASKGMGVEKVKPRKVYGFEWRIAIDRPTPS